MAVTAACHLRSADAGPPLLELGGVTKAFQTVVANRDVSLAIRPGEIHAVLGENGAGKSTLMKMIYGVFPPDAGEMRWNGETVVLTSPAQARKLGIGMVFQHFSLFESLTVAENISLTVPGGVARLTTRIREIGQRFSLPVNPVALVHSLSVGERQRVEIIRCLLQEPRLIIMDEPTSVLPPSGIPALFDTIRELAAQGCAVLFISHKLEEIRSLCHGATVMRAGEVVATVDPRRASASELAHLMIGREIPHPKRSAPTPGRDPVLELRGLSQPSDDPFGTGLHDVDLRLYPGEIVGIAGISGNGQKELAALLSGEAVLDRGRRDLVRILGSGCGDMDASRRRDLGLAFVPEDRNGRGSVPEMTLAENALLTGHAQGMVRRGLIERSRMRAFAETCIREMGVRCTGADAEARSLSGGNLQKFIMGREIRLKPKVLVAAQPTWGVDVGAAALIRQQLIDLRDAGVGILVISEELDELFEVSDRIHVLFRGRLSPALGRAEATVSTIGDYMTGGFLSPDATEARATA
ncbi:ABC transporter ATP-binding protein [Paracoccus siganidrum]|uniref:ABC transporter ATP-binding protein n=2 Tax=Paracoccus siganidrum TaxID=1276757 RepID=A0A419A648_9RHOB|nr:ABC transporter ATP-binding protein [Paracoccus siganidrum]RJL13094.1 ABC transporter ATP-binding protein [Paracoccus siganidrum]RMC33111.1 ABC transporter ATP-binding protein [Paracoccus siganidrum]